MIQRGIFDWLSPKKDKVYTFDATNKVYLIKLLKEKTLGDDYSIGDNFYKMPEKSWVSEVFAKKYKSFTSLISSKYNRKFECDDFAREAAYFCSLLENGVACGEFWFFLSTGQRHAINFFVCKDEELVFFEPQTYSIINLDIDEMRNCLNWRM